MNTESICNASHLRLIWKILAPVLDFLSNPINYECFRCYLCVILISYNENITHFWFQKVIKDNRAFCQSKKPTPSSNNHTECLIMHPAVIDKKMQVRDAFK